MSTFFDIPYEVIELIMLFCKKKSVVSMSKTCKLFYDISNKRGIKEYIINRCNLEHLSDEEINNLYNVITNNTIGNLYCYKYKSKFPDQQNIKNNNWHLSYKNVKSIKFGSIKFGTHLTFIIFKDGIVYCKDTSGIFLKMKDFVKLGNKNIKEISIGSNYVMFLDNDKKVYGWGSNNCQQMGNTEGLQFLDKITRIDELSNIKSISCGINHSLFLDHNGNVYSVGNGTLGKLGIGLIKSKTGNVSRFNRILNIPKISYIKAGSSRSFFITKKGIVYYCGMSLNGTETVTIPKRMIEFKFPIYKIITTLGVISRDFYIDINGNVYCTEYGDVGIKLLPNLVCVIDLCVMNPHELLCLSFNGNLVKYFFEDGSVIGIYETLRKFKKIFMGTDQHLYILE